MESDETNMPPFIGLARPQSAQAEAMPAQEPVACLWLLHGKVVNAFPWPPGDPEVWDFDGYWAAKGYARQPLYTAPPDLAARVAELEALLQDIEGEYANYTGSREMLPRIRAALAKVE